LFAALTVPTGLWLWNGLGPHFGLAKTAGGVDRGVAYATAVCVFILLAIGFAS
jgi:hypothetical protein